MTQPIINNTIITEAMEDYTPKIHENGRYIEMLIEAEKCICCDKIMISKLGYHSIFPRYVRINQEAQMKVAGFVYPSNTLVDDKKICIECEQSGKATILCALCEERKPSSKKQESIGDPAEFLCSDCFETKSAKIWDEKIKELHKSHKYDFE